MKRGTIDHPKTCALAHALNVPRYAAVGLLESLWHFTAIYAPRGDIGRWSDTDIAHALDWRGDPATLIAALVHTNWLTSSSRHRLLVHDWADHADNGVRARLRQRGEKFLESRGAQLSKSKAEVGLSPGSALAEQAQASSSGSESSFDLFPESGSGSGRRSGAKGSPAFEEVLAVYPAGYRDRADALNQWRVNDLEPHAAEIMAGVVTWKESERWQKGMIKNFSQFLKNELWRSPPPKTVRHSERTRRNLAACQTVLQAVDEES